MIFRGLLALSLILGLSSSSHAQSTGGSFPTPNGQIVEGFMLLVPCGPITNGQPSACPTGPATTAYFNCVNCSPSAPIGTGTNSVNGTIAVTNTFQPLIAVNSNRKGCDFQNNGSSVMYFSYAATPTLANSYQVQPGAHFYCSGNSNIVITDALQITGTATQAFAGGWQ